MEQLVMQATVPYKSPTHKLPIGYRFVLFDESEKDISDWKKIISEPPAPFGGADSCYHLMIDVYPDIDKKNDIYFIENEEGGRVATISVITHKDRTGYVHMVKAMLSERGKGLGHVMTEKALSVFSERGIEKVVLTTDDFRLPAIKTYLDAGFCPVVHGDRDSDINKRWDAVLEKLNYSSVRRIEET